MLLRRGATHTRHVARMTMAHTARRSMASANTVAATSNALPAVSAPAPPIRIVSGIQPTAGAAHLGNYLGAIAQWVKIQNGQPLDMEAGQEGSEAAATGAASTVTAATGGSESLTQQPPPLFIFLADLHALTARPAASQLRSSCLSVTATLLACGIDPARTALFRQSAPRLAGLHTELTWILGATTPVSWLSRMTQYKDKTRARGGANEATWGLLSYPALQAADILLYGATRVPVGRDQFQHVELCRDMAHLFNTHYASPDAHAAAASAGLPAPFTFPLPLHVATRSSRVMSLRSGVNKMSKSDPSDDSRLNLTDTPDQLASKIKRAKTDSDVGILLTLNEAGDDDPAKPETANLVRIMSELSGRSMSDILADRTLCASKQHFKQQLTEVVVQRLTPIREEFTRLHADEAYLRQVLDEGEKRAVITAEETMAQVRRAVGLA